ncbi:MAG TPA: hypothetical protein VHF47_09190, partial [Acidimicrobiales bacterium]|nr:hypothetical protein [Acidimicrobiales bacterium]
SLRPEAPPEGQEEGHSVVVIAFEIGVKPPPRSQDGDTKRDGLQAFFLGHVSIRSILREAATQEPLVPRTQLLEPIDKTLGRDHRLGGSECVDGAGGHALRRSFRRPCAPVVDARPFRESEQQGPKRSGDVKATAYPDSFQPLIRLLNDVLYVRGWRRCGKGSSEGGRVPSKHLPEVILADSRQV